MGERIVAQRPAAFADGRLGRYFASFESQRLIGSERAERERAAGALARDVEIERWTALPPGEVPVEVATKHEAEAFVAELSGIWKRRPRGAYRVAPGDKRRAVRVSRAEARRARA